MADSDQKHRACIVPQGTCSIHTNHAALLAIPEETMWAEDIAYARIYGVDSAAEAEEVLDCPGAWIPATEIDGDTFAELSLHDDPGLLAAEHQ